MAWTPRQVWRRLRASAFMHRLPQRYPGYAWPAFEKVCRVFWADTLGTLEERAFLFRLASDLPPDAVVIEIGSWVGISTCYLAAGLRGERACVYAVDSFQGLAEAGAGGPGGAGLFDAQSRPVGATWRAQVKRLGLAERIRLLEMESAAAVESIPVPRGTAAMVFFDGDHSYAGCQADFARWLPFLAPGGVAAIHDFGNHREVSRAVFEAILERKFKDVIGQKDRLFALKV